MIVLIVLSLIERFIIKTPLDKEKSKLSNKTSLNKSDIMQICRQYRFKEGDERTLNNDDIYAYTCYPLSWLERVMNFIPGIEKHSTEIVMCSDRIWWLNKQGAKYHISYSTLRNDPGITEKEIREIASAITNKKTEQHKIISVLTDLQSAP